MGFSASQRQCPKCDYGRFDQNRSETLSVDIAHNRQTINQATEQFYRALAQAKQENYQQLRVVVGGALINREIASILEGEHWRKQFRSFAQEPGNPGAFIIRLI